MDQNRVSGTVEKFAGRAEATIGDWTDDPETQTEGRAHELKGTAQNIIGQAKDGARSVADQVSGMAADAIEKGRDRLPDARQAYDNGIKTATAYSKQYPLTTVMMAGALGYLLSLLLNSKRA